MHTTNFSSPSTGAVIKQIMEINPSLGVQEIIHILRQCVEKNPTDSVDFQNVEVINKAKAFALAKSFKAQ